MNNQIVFDQHVQTALICLLLAALIGIGLAVSMLLDWVDSNDDSAN